MAQTIEQQLQQKQSILDNAIKNNASQSFINKYTQEVNNLKGQVEFGSKASVPTTVTPQTKTTQTTQTNNMSYTGNPTVTPQTTPAPTPKPTTTSTTGVPTVYTYPTTSTKTNTSTQTPQYNFTQTPSQNANNGVVPVSSGVATPASGASGQVGGVPGPVTPPVAQPQGAATNLSLRDVATGAGFTVGNVGNVPTINGVQIDPAKAGLQLIDGRWQGTAGQVGTALGRPVGLREGLEATGRTVGWDPNTGQVTVNGMPISTAGMINIDGRYYTTQDSINSIVARTGGKVPIGTGQQGQIQGQQGQEQGQQLETQDNSLKGQLDDVLRKNQELQQMLDEVKNIKIPEQDFTQVSDLLRQFQEYKAPFDEQIKQLLMKTYEGFQYDPESDPMLQKAIKYADRTMMEQMNSRGILSSSITADNLRYIREDLIPQYQDMALQRYNQELSNNFKRIDVLQSLNNTDYERYKNFASLAIDTAEKISKNTVDTFKANLELIQNSLTNQLALNKQDAEVKSEAYKNAYLKFKEIGYVDNEISLLTGLPVGARSKEAEDKIIERYDSYNKLQIQLENQITQQNNQLNNDLIKINEQNKEKQIEQKNKANAAKVYASLGNMSAEQALNEVSKNFATLSEYMGSELWMLVEKLNAQKVIDDKAKADREQDRIRNSLEAERIDVTRQQNAISNSMEQQRINIAKQTANNKSEKEATTMTTAEKNQYIAEAAKTYKSYPTTMAVEKLLTRAEQLITAVGPSGYKQIWDLALGEAVKRGETKLFNDYFKAPKSDSVKDLLAKYNIDLSALDLD